MRCLLRNAVGVGWRWSKGEAMCSADRRATEWYYLSLFESRQFYHKPQMFDLEIEPVVVCQMEFGLPLDRD